MRVSEIIKGTLDLIDGINLSNKSAPAGQQEYANAPHEITHTVAKVMTGGDDIHHEKHPSDMRSDSVSMYPKQGK
jgi:hypothetical protein